MKKTFFISILLLVALGMSAKVVNKKKKVTPVKKPVVSAQVLAEQQHFEDMLPSTAKLMFIDSMVVDKADFLQHIPFTPDMGRMLLTQGDVGYVNEFNDTEVCAHGDTVKNPRNLYLAHRYGKEWNESTELPELKGSFTWLDWPFLMSDGVTLYFSALGGEESLGKQDLYKANYNADESKFFDPTNMGFPYNSSANDYFLCISDYYNLGFLVSDRYQPEGKVCIYVFQPTEQRETFAEDTPEEKLKDYALLKRIKDTWGFSDREIALQRFSAMKEHRDKSASSQEKIYFVVNDKKVYTSLSNFRSANGKQQFQKLQQLQKKYKENEVLLEAARKSYNETPKAKRAASTSAKQIKTLEQQQPTILNDIKKLELELRKNEVSSIRATN